MVKESTWHGLVVLALLCLLIGITSSVPTQAEPTTSIAEATPPQSNLAKVVPVATVVATVNVNLLINRAPQAAEANDKLRQKFTPREAALQKDKDAIQALQDQIAQLPEEDRIQKERDLRSRQRDLDRAEEDFRAELRLARTEALSQLQNEVIEAINDIRVAEHIDIVLKESDFIAASPQVDITNKVLDYLQQHFNAAHAPATSPITKPKEP